MVICSTEFETATHCDLLNNNTCIPLQCTGCIGLFFPCYLFGKNAEFLGSGTLVGSCITHFILWALVNTLCCVLTQGFYLALPGFGCFISCYACGYRRALRSRYNLQVFAYLFLFSSLILFRL